MILHTVFNTIKQCLDISLDQPAYIQSLSSLFFIKKENILNKYFLIYIVFIIVTQPITICVMIHHNQTLKLKEINSLLNCHFPICHPPHRSPLILTL